MHEHLDPNKIVEEVEQLTSGLFERMELAENEITAAIERDPEHAEAYDAAFKLLVPTDTLISDSLYQRHCHELLSRVAEGQDTRPGTDAEILGAFSQATHAAPPNTTLSLAYARLFRRLFPEHAETADSLAHSVGRERYEGDVDDLIAWSRKKLAMKERVME